MDIPIHASTYVLTVTGTLGYLPLPLDQVLAVLQIHLIRQIYRLSPGGTLPGYIIYC